MQKAIAVLVVLLAGAALAALVYPYTEEDNHHEVIEVPTPREGVVCYALLDASRQPTDLSCVRLTQGDNHATSDLGGEHAAALLPRRAAATQW